MSIGVVLIVISIFIAWRIKGLLVGRSADPEIREAIDAILAGQPCIDRVFNTITVQYGPDTMLAAKVKICPGVDIDTAVANINDLERKLKERIPNLRWCFIEPDVKD
jgi:divalent metal cation (Fe/Co/Zn/Cd) transporter